MTGDATVSAVDIGPFREAGPGQARVAKEVGRACEEIGFLSITGHGIPAGLIADTYDVCRTFFDSVLKGETYPTEAHGPVVYTAVQAERLGNTLDAVTPGDLKESLDYGPLLNGNTWPGSPEDLQTTCERYFQALSELGATMRQIFAVALELPKTFFDPYFTEHNSCFRAINYPEPQVTPLPGQLRAGEHTDYGCMTILRVEDVPGGLEVRDRSGRWSLVPAMTGAFVVNIGDMMARWTNDRWVSTLHRVANPPLDRTLGTRRQSLVFFVNPNPSAVIECIPSCTDAVHPPKYAPITAAAHMAAKEQKARG